jgi:hypothetical protein
MTNTFGLVCYTISDSETDSEGEETDTSTEAVVNYVIEHILAGVCHGLRDFSDMYIKQEPEDCDDLEMEQNYGDSYDDRNVKLESEDSEDSDSDDSSSSEEDVTASKEIRDNDIPSEVEGMCNIN